MGILEDKRRGPDAGEASSVVVFLHGYGADGADLMGLAGPLAPHMPGTAFRAPDAPEPCRAAPMGRQWFPIPQIDGARPEEMERSFTTSAAKLEDYLDEVLAEEGLPADRMVLFGFSQGTMMSLHVAPRRPEPVAGIAGFSGRLMLPERLADEAVSKPPVMLFHGNADDVVPFESMGEAETALKDAGFLVKSFVMEGTPHGIAPDGLGAALGFMKAALAME